MPKDLQLKLVAALPSASANNLSNVIDLGDADDRSERWRLGWVDITFPALSAHTNTSAAILVDLYHGTDSNTANHTATNVIVELNVPGVASTGSAAKAIKMPFPPDVKRYVSFKQTASANSNTGPNSNVTYELRVA